MTFPTFVRFTALAMRGKVLRKVMRVRVSFAHAGNVHGNVIPVRCNRQPGAGFSPGGVHAGSDPET